MTTPAYLAPPVRIVDSTGTDVSLGSGSTTSANPGADSTQATSVQGVTNGKPITVTNSNPVYLTTVQSFTRPSDTTAYTAPTGTTTGDLVANSTTAGSVTPLSFTIPSISGSGNAAGLINFLQLRTSQAVVADTTIRCHIFQTTSPTLSNGDNGVYQETGAFELGFVDVVLQPSGIGSMGGSDSMRLPYNKATADNLYVILENRTAFTPTSGQTFGVILGALRSL